MNDMSPLAYVGAELQNIEAEQALLGAILVNNEAFYRVSDFLKPQHFFEPIHKTIFEVAGQLIRANKIATPVTMKTFLPADMVIGDINLPTYLARLAAEATTIINAEDYGRVIHEWAGKRSLIGIGQSLIDKVLDGGDADVPDLAAKCEVQLLDLMNAVTPIKPRTIGDFAVNAIDQTAMAYKNSAIPGFTTGLATLDGKIGPIFRGDLVTLIADSGSGKTAAAVQILENAAAPSLDGYQASPSLLIEMEMKGVKIARRRLARDTGVSTRKQAEGTVIEGEFRRLIPAAQNLSGLRLYIDDKGKRSLADIEMVIRSMHRSENIGMVAVDHVVLIEPDHPRDTDIDTIKKAAKRLKQLAMDLDIAVLVLAQTTREAQKRRTLRDLRPRISDIYGGEFLRQESDIVIGLCNPGSILPDMEPATITGESTAVEKRDRALWDRLVDEWRGRAEIAGLKLRDGEKTGWARIGFDGAGTRFFDEDRR